MPSLKDLKVRIKSVKSTRIVRIVLVFLAAGVFMQASAFASPATSPEDLVQKFRTAYEAKDCPTMLTLNYFEGVPDFALASVKQSACYFEPKIRTMTLTELRPQDTAPQPGPGGKKVVPNLPLVKNLVIDFYALPQEAPATVTMSIGKTPDGGYTIAAGKFEDESKGQ